MSVSPDTSMHELLQEKWPQITFDGDNDTLLWKDGPTVQEVRDVLGPALAGPALFPLRILTFTAWAALQGPRTEPTTETPWDHEKLLAHLPGHIHHFDAVLEEMAQINLEDLPGCVGNADILAQAEISGGIYVSPGRYSHACFDLWLHRGGWAMAGTLLQDTHTV